VHESSNIELGWPLLGRRRDADVTRLEQVRLAAALVHAIPGALLSVETCWRERVTVGRHVSCDLDPCRFRSLVAASRCPGRPDLARHVDRVELAGSVRHLGGGVLRTCTGRGVEQRWVATLLAPDVVVDWLTDQSCGDAIEASVRPDAGLGVTLVVASTADPLATGMLEELGLSLAARVAVDELIGGLTSTTI
jgi:hypothetical protein